MSINFNSVKRIYVHAGAFNTDDVISLALVKTINPSIEIVRTGAIIDNCDDSICLGIGNGEYSLSTIKNKKDASNNPYCLSSLVY
jgi:hypothetical protein